MVQRELLVATIDRALLDALERLGLSARSIAIYTLCGLVLFNATFCRVYPGWIVKL